MEINVKRVTALQGIERRYSEVSEMAEQKGSSIFRKKSMDRVSSPEALNDYIRVTTPSVWIVLIALVLLLAGMLIWSIFGTVEVHNADGSTQEIAPITYIMN